MVTSICDAYEQRSYRQITRADFGPSTLCLTTRNLAAKEFTPGARNHRAGDRTVGCAPKVRIKPLARSMLSSSTERTRARGRTAMTESLNRILVPIDFSAHSEKAIRYATTLANKFGARLSLLHVIEDPFVTGAWQAEVFVPNIPELLNDLIKAAQAHMAEHKKHLTAHGFLVETVVITGRPASAIVEQASAGRFDLIVMGTHGRTRLSHALLGSVAERVVQKSACPVLTVRETAPAAAKAESAATIAAV
jgi:universal stress protein A